MQTSSRACLTGQTKAPHRLVQQQWDFLTINQEQDVVIPDSPLDSVVTLSVEL